MLQWPEQFVSLIHPATCHEYLTFWNSEVPRLPASHITCSMTDPAPADSPAMVTRAGSPPKRLTFVNMPYFRFGYYMTH